METWSISLVTLLSIIIILFAGTILFLVFLLVKQKNNVPPNSDNTNDNSHPNMFCSLHPGIISSGLCRICEKPFCEDCLCEHENLTFCPEHFELFNKNKWSDISTVKTTPEQTEKAMPIYNFKELIWEQDKIPSYIITNYKIDVENDTIESYVSLYVRENDKDELSMKLEKSLHK